jgi:uncharacterized protein with PQ loop repeat
MKKNQPLIAAILTMIVFYLLVSFVIWDLNAKHWSLDARFMYSLFGTAFSIWVYAGIKLNQI